MKFTQITTLIIIAVFIFGAGLFFGHRESAPVIEYRSDTVTVCQTVRDTVLKPVHVYVERIDTVYMSVPGDTVRIPVYLPIERKIYQTDDYRAVIEGWQADLLEMEVYRKTEYITTTETHTVKTKPRFGIGLQAGYGFNGQRFAPYVGVGLQYNIITF